MKVIIVGKGNGWEKAPLCLSPCEDNEAEHQSFVVWGVNNVCLRREVDLAFNMHDLVKHCRHHLFMETIVHVNKHKIPIVTQREYHTIPTCVPFPLEYFKRKYFTNSIDYMVAYACYVAQMDADYNYLNAIEMYGVTMAVGTEYTTQRPSLEYWIGVAEGEGITVTIHEPTCVCVSLKGLYGYDWDEEDAPHVKARGENQ